MQYDNMILSSWGCCVLGGCRDGQERPVLVLSDKPIGATGSVNVGAERFEYHSETSKALELIATSPGCGLGRCVRSDIGTMRRVCTSESSNKRNVEAETS